MENTSDLAIVQAIKRDNRLGPEFLTVNEFVGVWMGKYDPIREKWKK